MTKISESATIARDSVVRNFVNLEEVHPELKGAASLEWPGDNYLKAAALVWFFLKQEAARQNGECIPGDNDRGGRIVKGVSHKDAISMLWPTVHKSDFNRVQQGVSKFLKQENNYVVLQKQQVTPRGTLIAMGEYWIADEWQSPQRLIVRKVDGPGTPRVPRRLIPDEVEPEFVAPKKDSRADDSWAAVPVAHDPIVTLPDVMDYSTEINRQFDELINEVVHVLNNVRHIALESSAQLEVAKKERDDYKQQLETVRRALGVADNG